MLKNISSQLSTTFRSAFHRFAVTILWLTAQTVCLLLVQHKVIADDDAGSSLVIGLANAALFSLMLKLTLETSDNRRLKALCHLVGYVLVAAFSIFLYFQTPFNIVEVTLILSVETALVAAIFIIPLSHEHGDLPLWNLLMRATAGVVVSVIAVGVLVLGLDLLIQFICLLFQIDLGFDLSSDISIIGFAWLAPVIVLQFAPKAQNLHNSDSSGLPYRLQEVVRFVLFPLLLVYILTLYVYAAKILFTWQLPNGSVSWPVSIMMALLVAGIILLFPSTYHPEKRFDNLMLRWLPVAVLPLLALMTVAIGRRLSDYGVSVARLYVLAFNLWCYAVCILMLIAKTRRRILTIGISSFALVLLLTSAGPWSFANMVYRDYKDKVEQVLKTAHLPSNQMNYNQLNALTQSMKPADCDFFMTRLNVLRDAYGKRGMEEWLTENAWQMVASYQVSTADGSTSTASLLLTPDGIDDLQWPVPAGYTKVTTLSLHEATVVKAGPTFFVLKTFIDGEEPTFTFNLRDRKEIMSGDEKCYLLKGTCKDTLLLMVTDKPYDSLRPNTKISYTGILYTK
jgi:hypothetical protein